MRPRNAAHLIAVIIVAALLQACAAIVASNEPQRNGLIDRIHQGMTEGEVRSVLGQPDEVMAFARSQTVSWDYRYTDTWGFLAMFSVTFGTDGRVVSTGSRRLNDGRSGSGMT